jgi:hypothetical protein
LNAGAWLRRVRFVIISPVPRHHRRVQAEIPLIPVFEFGKPPLNRTYFPKLQQNAFGNQPKCPNLASRVPFLALWFCRWLGRKTVPNLTPWGSTTAPNPFDAFNPERALDEGIILWLNTMTIITLISLTPTTTPIGSRGGGMSGRMTGKIGSMIMTRLTSFRL